jgi:hypothetical protein
MGLDTLVDRADDQTISQDWYNSVHSALKGDFVPRDSSGAPTNNAGAFGSTTYTWTRNVAYSYHHRALNNSNLVRVKAPDDLAATIDMIWPTALPSGKRVVLMDQNGQLYAEQVTRTISPSSGAWFDSTGSFVTVTNFAISLTVPAGRDVEVFVIPDGNTSTSAAVGGNTEVHFQLLRDATEVGRAKIDNPLTSTLIRVGPGCLRWIDENPGAGTYLYTLKGRNTTDSVFVQYCKMVARVAP